MMFECIRVCADFFLKYFLSIESMKRSQAPYLYGAFSFFEPNSVLLTTIILICR